MEIFYTILKLIAGLGLFLYAIHVVSVGLEHVVGSRLRKSITKLTDSKIKGFGFGVVITAVLQSSSASIAMLVGLVTSGIINLSQIFPIIVGTNIGAVIPMIFVSFQAFNISKILSVLCLIGILMIIFSKKNNIKQIGNLLVGIGLLFLGLMLMSEAVIVFKNNPQFINIMLSLDNPLLLILVGMVFTILIQSSLASTAVLITLCSTGSTSLMTITSIAFLIYGINIGTSISTSLSAFGGTVNAKRTAFMHVLFNVVGSIVMSLLTFLPWLNILQKLISNVGMQIVTIQIIYKILIAILLLPLSNLITKLSQKIIPMHHNIRIEEIDEIFVINDDIFGTPSIALKQIGQSIYKFYELVGNLIDNTVNIVLKKIILLEPKLTAKRENLKKIAYSITNNLVKISGDLTQKDAFLVSTYHEILSDIKGIIYSCQRLIQCEKYNFTTKQNNEVQEIYKDIKKLLKNSYEIISVMTQETYANTEEKVKNVLELNTKILELKSITKKQNILVKSGETTKLHDSILFNNTLNELQNICESITNIVIRVS
ncbi:MAG: Na/Pi symporter [Clostridia bacterium]|nr:Na/Pi symporter [Clostridia bacterium]